MSTATAPRTTTELMAAAATALRERDEHAIDALMDIARSWLQPADETAAQMALLEQISEAIYELRGAGL